jgi:exopolysaccharide production protein ExoQ
MALRAHLHRDARLGRFLASPAFAQAFASSTLFVLFLGHLIRATMGWPGYVGMLGVLVVVAVAVFVVRQHDLELRRSFPLALAAFLFWSVLSTIWSRTPEVALPGVLFQLVVAFLGAMVAMTRDMIQIVRAAGGVLRVALGLSLFVEILAGILLDTKFGFLGVNGKLADGGPIQGVFGTRNLLALVCLLAIATFGVEWVTQSVDRRLAVVSLVLAGVLLGFSRSPSAVAVALALAVAAIGLAIVRRVPEMRRRLVQGVLAAVAVLGVVLIVVYRAPLIERLDAARDLNVRLQLWHSIQTLARGDHLYNGWGWTGYWSHAVQPYATIDLVDGTTNLNALNGFFDVQLQLGLVGLVLFVIALVATIGRSWLLASNKRSLIWVWPTLVLAVLIVVSLVESAVLVEFGWFLLVVCTVKSAQSVPVRRGSPIHV